MSQSLSKGRLEFLLAIGEHLGWGEISNSARCTKLGEIAGCGGAIIAQSIRENSPGNLGPDKVDAIKAFVAKKNIPDLDPLIWLHPNKRAALEQGSAGGKAVGKSKAAERTRGTRGSPAAPAAILAPKSSGLLIVHVSGGNDLFIKAPPGMSVTILEASQEPGQIVVVKAKIC